MRDDKGRMGAGTYDDRNESNVAPKEDEVVFQAMQLIVAGASWTTA